MDLSKDYDGNVTAALDVSDLDRSVAWYQDVLGFELLYRVDDIGWCELKTATSGLTIGLSVADETKQGGGATLTIGVRDVAAAKAAIESKDVQFEGDVQTIPGMVSLATFHDPDGNLLKLAQDLFSH